MPDLSHVETWVFDLDHTLYPPETNLFAQIEPRMTGWIATELGVSHARADALRRDYWARYGSTLGGLITEHGIETPAYLAHVHDIDYGVLRPDPRLARALAGLPGRRIVHTNGTSHYARKVLAALRLDDLFHAVYGIEEAGLISKPEAAAFHAIAASDGFSHPRAAMFEDTPDNLRVPHALGMATVLVGPTRAPGDHIHHHTTDLAGFLSQAV